jgi:hypothetical protein
LGVLILSWSTRRDVDLRPCRIIAATLCISWLSTKLLAMAIGWEATYHLFPLIDFVILLQVLLVWWFIPERWLQVQIFLLLTKLVLHAIYGVQTVHYVMLSKFWYIATNNVLFGLELACVAFPGGWPIIRRFGDWMSGAGDLHRRLGLSRWGPPFSSKK